MVVSKNIKSFEWDKGNIDKNYQKHGITPNESEEIFLDGNLKVIRDIKHSQKEERFIAVGKSFRKKILFVVFNRGSFGAGFTAGASGSLAGRG